MMNQKRKKSGFFFNRSKRSKKPSPKPQTCLRKQHKSCFSMHSRPAIFSIMCRCSYAVKKEHPNKPVEAPTEPQQWHKNVTSPTPREATLITKYDYSRKSEASPSTPSKVSMIKRGKLKKKVTIGSNQTSTVVDGSGGGGGGGDEAEWPPSTDEDYIVFCFEEDGEFRVVMEENLNSRSHDLLELGNSDVSPTPHNLKVEEERFYFSPRLQSDGIRSSTRFKQVEHEESSRGRVDEEKECKDMDEIKSRGTFDDDDGDDDDQEQEIESEEDVEFRDASTECIHGSNESSDSIQSDWEQLLQLQVTEPSGTIQSEWEQLLQVDEEIAISSSPSLTEDGQIPNEERDSASPSDTTDSDCLITNKMVEDEEESVYLSSESQQEESQDSDEHSNNDEQSTGTSRSEIIEEEKFEDHEEPARISVVSSKSSEDYDRISTSSFEFPVLPWEWIGSPDIWPKSETPTTIHFRKQKSNKVRLGLCRF